MFAADVVFWLPRKRNPTPVVATVVEDRRMIRDHVAAIFNQSGEAALGGGVFTGMKMDRERLVKSVGKACQTQAVKTLLVKTSVSSGIFVSGQ